jgi:hypothetical protein
MTWRERFIKRTANRKHDFAIGGEENPYCLRWWVIPRNRFFNVYLHCFLRDDDDRALHDHPWANCSIPLVGGYREQRFKWPWRDGWVLPLTEIVDRPVGSVTFRWGSTPHRVILCRDLWGVPVPAWSLFITGPVLRQRGFVCPAGRWVHWKDFTDARDYGRVGKGCDE